MLCRLSKYLFHIDHSVLSEQVRHINLEALCIVCNYLVVKKDIQILIFFIIYNFLMLWRYFIHRLFALVIEQKVAYVFKLLDTVYSFEVIDQLLF